MTQIIIDPSKRPSRLLSLFKYTLISLSIVLSILFAILAGAANPILNNYLDDLNQIWSESIGGDLKIKQVQTSVFPWFVFELKDLELDEILKVKSVALELDTFTALISRGHTIKVDRALIEDVDLKLIKSKDGTWNFESYQTQQDPLEVNERISEDKGSLTTNQKVSSQSEADHSLESLLQKMQALKIGKVYCKGIRVSIEDQSQESFVPINLVEIDWAFNTFEPARELKTRLKAKVLNQVKGLVVDVHIGPFDEYLKSLYEEKQARLNKGLDAIGYINPPFPIKISMTSDEIDFAPIRSLLPNQNKHFAQMKTEGNLELLLQPNQDMAMNGEWFVKRLMLEAQSAPFDIKFAPQISFSLNPKEQIVHLSLGQSHLSVNDMRLGLNGKITKKPSSLSFKSLVMNSQGFNFEKIAKLVPQLNRSLPQGSHLSGPFKFDVNTSGDSQSPEVQLKLDFEQAKIRIPALFQKLPNDPLGLKATIGLQGQIIKVKDFEFYLGQAKLRSSGTIDTVKQDLRLSLETRLQGLSMQELSRHLPQVQHELTQSKTRVSGELGFESRLSASILKSGMQVDLESALAIQGADLDTGSVKIKGSGGIKLDFKQKSKDELFALFDSNLSSLDLKFGDHFHKSSKQAFDIELEIKKTSKKLTVPQFNFHLADLKLRGVAQQSAGQYELKALLKPSPLKSLLEMFGASQSLGSDLRQGKLGFSFKLTAGDRPEAIQINLSDLKFKAPKNVFRADLKMKDLHNPKLQFKFSARKFDLDRLVPAPANNEQPNSVKHTQAESSTQDSAQNETQDQKYRLNGTVLIKRGHARGLKFKNLNLQVSAQENGLEVSNASVQIFGGSMAFAPLKLNLVSNQVTEWSSQLKLDKIQLSQVQKQLFKNSNLRGKLSGDLNLEGHGQEWKSLSNSLLGHGGIKVESLQIRSLDLNRALLQSMSKAIKGKIKSYKIPRVKSRPFQLKTFKEKVSFKAGKINFKDALQTKVNGSPLDLKGGIGLDGTLDFDAQLMMSAKQVSSWLKIPLQKAQNFPIDFKLGGDLAQPSIKSYSALTLIAAVTVASGLSVLADTEIGDKVIQGVNALKKKGENLKRQTKEQVKELKSKAKKQVKEAKAQIEAEVEKRLDDGQASLEKEGKKVKRKAKKAKKRAEKKLKRKAKEALKGLF